jgi:hypothetical protein
VALGGGSAAAPLLGLNGHRIGVLQPAITAQRTISAHHRFVRISATVVRNVVIIVPVSVAAATHVIVVGHDLLSSAMGVCKFVCGSGSLTSTY